MKRKILFVFGTRPEAIKLAPLIKKFQENKSKYIVEICITSQHKSMLTQALKIFQITPNYNLKIMKKEQSLEYITGAIINKLSLVVKNSKPDMLIVQGDTTTTMASSLVSFYRQIKLAHIEAGLRSFDKYKPFPEEINRCISSRIADFNFAPTSVSQKNLRREGISKEKIFTVGNTVIDALLIISNQVQERDQYYFNFFRNKGITFNKKIILVTGHRRENFGKAFLQICKAIKRISKEDVEIVYPVHLNPNVQEPVNNILSNLPNVKLIDPLEYDKLVYLMNKTYLILTDSGGIQEEAPSLGKPVLVMRTVTERPEGVKAGCVKLVGTQQKGIERNVLELLKNESLYKQMSKRKNPYGNGHASDYIFDVIDNYYSK